MIMILRPIMQLICLKLLNTSVGFAIDVGSYGLNCGN